MRSVATLCLTMLCVTANAKPLPLWELESASNRVIIMGSVHFLRPSDYPLRDGFDQAYQLADTIVMEINMGAIDAASAQGAVASMSIDPQGRNLQQLIGDQAFNTADKLAAELGIPLMTFSSFEPWFAALSITQLRMLQLGFDPSWGVETMLTRKAQQEGKTLDGLETIEEQLGFLDRLDTDTQSRFLLQSLEDAATVQNEVETIVAAWNAGDTERLEKSLLQGLDDAPELYDALLVQRNRNWVEPIKALRNKPGNYLVVVGAMHLIGDDSVLAMLEDAGVNSRQLQDADFN